MPTPSRSLMTAAAAVSFLACLSAGVWLLAAEGFQFDDGALSTAIGLYFIGKAFFVGPMLLAASRREPDAR
jgi:hypothetical protein